MRECSASALGLCDSTCLEYASTAAHLDEEHTSTVVGIIKMPSADLRQCESIGTDQGRGS